MKVRGDTARTCASTGKRVYATRVKALRHLDMLRARHAHGENRNEASAYLCPSCGFWHLTSRPASPALRAAGRAAE